ncbi:MAG: carboxylate--amine ligase [Clostridiales bacterium]|nr:carboxylate--amine ligase [Clostridiales bacterium]
MENKVQYYKRVIRDASLGRFFNVVKTAHERSGKNSLFLFFDIINCMIRYKAGYNDYVIFEFWDLKHEQRDTYMTRFRSKKFIMFMNDQSASHLVDNKNEFNELFKDFIGRECLDIETATKEDIISFFETREKVFAKMKNLSCGIGCEKLEMKDFKDGEEFYEYVKKQGFGTIEDVIENHPDIAKIYPYSVNTLRIITIIDGKGVPHAIYAVFKMGINGRVVDNYGLHGPLDLETGKFMFPAHSGLTTAGIHYTKHPYSDTPLVGMKVPYAIEALRFAEKAALVVPQIRYIGWDVAITPNGPVIIEGNDYCAHDFWQLPGQTPGGIGIMPTIAKYIPEFKYK